MTFPEYSISFKTGDNSSTKRESQVRGFGVSFRSEERGQPGRVCVSRPPPAPQPPLWGQTRPRDPQPPSLRRLTQLFPEIHGGQAGHNPNSRPEEVYRAAVTTQPEARTRRCSGPSRGPQPSRRALLRVSDPALT